ncbi:MAG: single-stranded-DNA-specific exonuclease RecJ [Proteobacteria bacterium]|nr:single-stranded-DNA-specific exonuclease RecJ [Candidatus Enterousia scatequi]
MRSIVDKSVLGQTWMLPDDIGIGGDKDFVTNILHLRGIVDDADVMRFLSPSVKDSMPNPSVLRDMDKAVSVIINAICAKQKIAIYGDYDVDGITSTAICVKYLRAIGCDVVWYIPTRDGEGYGLNNSAIDKLADLGVNLILTVDCGISCVSEVEYAKLHGCNIVITDHHLPEVLLPDADAVVNPKRIDDESGLNYLAGVGVAFLVLVALNRELKKLDTFKDVVDGINLLDYLDLVSLGTICDTMPLINLNRAYVATGLKVMDLRHNLGLKTLMDVAKVKKPTVYSAGFVLGPRLNAAGRLDSAEPALELLLTDNPLIARDLAEKLHAMNQERVDIQNAIMVDAIDKAQKCCDKGRCSLFVCGDGWHGGIMGIIAGRLKDKYNLPTCVATKIDGVINGSGRSVASVDLGKIIHDAIDAGIVSEGGGHAAAAGFSLPENKEQDFCEFLENAVMKQLNGAKPTPTVMVDAELDASGANMGLVRELSKMEPFGQGNPEPVLVLHGAVLRFASVMGSGSHLRGTVGTSNGTNLSFVGFNLVGTPVGDFLLDDANTNTKITMLGRLKENDYNGRISAQFTLEDIAIL